MWTVPNSLTFLRLALVPVFIWQTTRGTAVGAVIALVAFGAAGITDSLDGYYARKHGTHSDLGRFLDPLADKLLILSAFYWGAIGAGASRSWFLIWLVHVIALREVGITALRIAHRRRGRQIVTAWAGKWKTGLQVAVLVTVLTLEAAGRLSGNGGLPAAWLGSGIILLLVQVLFGAAVLLTVVSGVRYLTVDARTVPLSGSEAPGT